MMCGGSLARPGPLRPHILLESSAGTNQEMQSKPQQQPLKSVSAEPVIPERSPVPEGNGSAQEELILQQAEAGGGGPAPTTQRCREHPSRIDLGARRPLSSFASQRCVKMLMKGVII